MTQTKKFTSLDLADFMKKVKKMEKGEKFDLSSDEDLSIAIMNLISIEEHLFFTANKTGKSSYYDLLYEVREMRKELLAKIIKEYEGENWCISKHLLASSMRLMEVGTKMLTKGDNKAAQEMFKKSYNLYSLFWGLNLGAVKLDGSNQAKLGDNIELLSDTTPVKSKVKLSVFDKLSEMVKKAVDCCIE
ncbi:MAG TPA: hypothetical protein PLQ50_00460 [Candidatus Woesebacteria bacterium]|nr:hypothetical protein [Candidatus Woesebacteria bacterium]